MVTNEVFIDSATLRENIVSLARNIGYLPRSRKASRTSISFFVDTTEIIPSPSIVTLKKGVVATTAGTFGNQSYIFSILEDISVPVFNNIAEFTDIVIHEGNVLNINFTYSLRNPTQKFIIPNSGVDTELISVHVKSNEQSTRKTKYNAHSSLFDIGRDSKVYYLQEIEDERYQLLFGDGVFGKKLEEGNFIEADYIVTNGDTGNGVGRLSFGGNLTYSRNGEDYNITSGISLMTTNAYATGGEMIESIDSIRKFAPRIYASQNRAVTAADYESLVPARIYPETESISVFGGEELIPPQYGKVFISIKPRTGDFLPNLIKENIKMRLKKYAVAGIVPEILDLKYLYLEIRSQIYFNSNLARNGAVVSDIVQNNANKYAESSELNKYGARFKYSKFLNIVDQSHEAITSNITTVEMRRDLRLVLNKVTEYSIGFGNQFHIRSMSGYNIKSSGFTIEGITNTVYISDIPNTNRVTGSLFLFTIPNPNSYSPTIIRRNIGVINYVSGIITLNPIVTTSGKVKEGQSIIELSVCPKSNDVIGLQDLYLQLDIGSSIFEPIVDQIASGADPAGSKYIVSSSYQNGALVRA